MPVGRGVHIPPARPAATSSPTSNSFDHEGACGAAGLSEPRRHNSDLLTSQSSCNETREFGRKAMLSRRDGLRLAGAVAAASFGGVSIGKAEAAAAPSVKTPVNFDVPRGAVDCHTHVFPDPQKFPFWSGACLYAAGRDRRRSFGAAKSAAHGSRGHRHAKRLRHRQFRDTRRH